MKRRTAQTALRHYFRQWVRDHPIKEGQSAEDRFRECVRKMEHGLIDDLENAKSAKNYMMDHVKHLFVLESREELQLLMDLPQLDGSTLRTFVFASNAKIERLMRIFEIRKRNSINCDGKMEQLAARIAVERKKANLDPDKTAIEVAQDLLAGRKLA